MLDVIVIGAGQAGLAAAHALTQAGLSFKVLEAGDRAAGSWPHYYDSLTLFSPARFNSLPELPFPGAPDRYPLRDEVIAYLENYARHFDFPLVYQARVRQIVREGEGFLVSTESGQTWQARAVIAASGPFNQPNIPAFAGLPQFAGRLLHSSAYLRPADVAGSRVAVVGSGNSAVQIAYELAQTHQVILTARQAPRFINQRPFGLDLHVWLTRSGLDRFPLGDWFGLNPTTPVLDHGLYRQAFVSGQLNYRPLFDRVTSHGLQWGDSVEPVDTLIMATGFINSPAYLAGLDGQSAAAAAEQRGGVATQVPGLFFVGTAWQRSHASATLRGVGPDAVHVVKQLRRYLQAKTATAPVARACCR
ncbi:MAG: NAD(P)-binding domain-containing protein [Rheinheimera sp.]|nr:NAD(P)-binding domain-containing protein [Rheinheimera sp.]